MNDGLRKNASGKSEHILYKIFMMRAIVMGMERAKNRQSVKRLPEKIY